MVLPNYTDLKAIYRHDLVMFKDQKVEDLYFSIDVAKREFKKVQGHSVEHIPFDSVIKDPDWIVFLENQDTKSMSPVQNQDIQDLLEDRFNVTLNNPS